MRTVFRFLFGVMITCLIGLGANNAYAQANPTITFTNATGSYVQQFHVMPDGSKNRHAELAPGAVVHVVSKSAQTWVFEISGQVMGSYVTSTSPNQSYTISGKSDPGDEAPVTGPRGAPPAGKVR